MTAPRFGPANDGCSPGTATRISDSNPRKRGTRQTYDREEHPCRDQHGSMEPGSWVTGIRGSFWLNHSRARPVHISSPWYLTPLQRRDSQIIHGICHTSFSKPFKVLICEWCYLASVLEMSQMYKLHFLLPLRSAHLDMCYQQILALHVERYENRTNET